MSDSAQSTCRSPRSPSARGQNDSGVFELNFRDERYIPFEGAGAISKWRVELPEKFRQFDYDSITDVVMHLRYTAVDGGDKLKKPAEDSVQEYIKSIEELSREEGLFAVFDLKNDFPNEWHDANHPPAGATGRELTISKLNEKLPVFTKGHDAKKIVAKNIYLFVSDSISAPITATQDGVEIPFGGRIAAGKMNSLVANDVEFPLGDIKIKIQDPTTEIGKMWLVARYTLS